MASTFSDFHSFDNSPLTANNQSFVPTLNQVGMAGSTSMISLSGEFGAIVSWIRHRLGASLMGVEISPEAISVCFEESNLQFSSLVNSFFIQSWFASLLGLNRDYNQFDFQNALPKANNAFVKAFTIGNINPMDAGVKEKRKGFIIPDAVRQGYDFYSEGIDANSSLPLEQYIASVSGYDAVMTKCFFNSGYYMNRLFDPMSNQQFFMSEFGFPAYPTDTVFYILPLNEDIMRGNLIKSSDYARKPEFRYMKFGRTIEFTPVPKSTQRIWFEYYIDLAPGTEISPLANSSFSGLDYLSTVKQKVATNFGNIPVETLTYDSMNDIGRTWVRSYTFALCMETLGWTRNKFTGIPIPGMESVTLNGSDLAAAGSAKRAELIQQLTSYLENIDSYKIMEKEAAKTQQMIEILKMQPSPIFAF